MARKRPKGDSGPRPGDLVLVVWEDIAGAESGHPESPVFVTPGYYVGWYRKAKRRYLHVHRSVLYGSTSTDFNDCRGWDIYPAGCVLEVKKVDA